MAEESQSKALEVPLAAEVVVIEEYVAAAKEAPAGTVVIVEELEKPTEEKTEAATTEVVAKKSEEAADTEGAGGIVPNRFDPEKKALDELKQLVRAALANNEFNLPPAPPASEQAKVESAPPQKPEETPKPSVEPAESGKEEPFTFQPAPLAAEEKAGIVENDGAKAVEATADAVLPVADAPVAAAPPVQVSIWGVPLLVDERTDTVLLKFLRARGFKVKEAMAMLKNTVIWRKQFGIDNLLEEDLCLPELEKAIFMHGADREGRPVCYNVYGEFQNQELYEKTFGDEAKRERFLKWRIQFLEKVIREYLDFSPGGVCSMIQVTDMKNSPSQGKHRQVANQVIALLQDYYPDFIAKKVFVNVSWWMKLASTFMISPKTKNKFVFAGPSRSADTLFKFIAAEQVPVAYGGLSRDKDAEDFTIADAVTLITLKPSSSQSIEIPVTKESVLLWELRVLGWEVSYGSEFVPEVEDGYTVIVQKTKKMMATDDEPPVINGAYKTSEPGKVVLNIHNPTSKKKKVLYRFKAKSITDSS